MVCCLGIYKSKGPRKAAPVNLGPLLPLLWDDDVSFICKIVSTHRRREKSIPSSSSRDERGKQKQLVDKLFDTLRHSFIETRRGRFLLKISHLTPFRQIEGRREKALREFSCPFFSSPRTLRKRSTASEGGNVLVLLLKACAELRSCTSQLATTNALRTEWLTKNYCVFY